MGGSKNIFGLYKKTSFKVGDTYKERYVLNFFGIKFCFKRNHIFKNNKIFVSNNGKNLEYEAIKFEKIFGVKVIFNGDDNIVNIVNPQNIRGSRFVFNGFKNILELKGENSGIFNISFYDECGKVVIGEKSRCCSIFITCINNTILIGKDCMISNNVRIWGDGHSVLDFETKEILNIPHKPINIGNHVWLGERVTITKNANIQEDCIVGIASVVTKDFSNYTHCLIAGNPAQVKKSGITWNVTPPLKLKKERDRNV